VYHKINMLPRIRIKCPRCHSLLQEAFLRSAVGRMNNRLHTPTGPRKVLRPCPFCNKKFGARDIRVHKPRCPKKPEKRISDSSTKAISAR
jgi:hypothetical protein